jgi:hypothetical protein
MHGELMNDTMEGGANFDAFQHVFRRHFSFHQLGSLGTDIGKFLTDLTALLPVDLEDLQLGFGNLALDLGGGGGQL